VIQAERRFRIEPGGHTFTIPTGEVNP
jgi:hypothetical protein